MDAIDEVESNTSKPPRRRGTQVVFVRVGASVGLLFLCFTRSATLKKPLVFGLKTKYRTFRNPKSILSTRGTLER